MIKQYVIEYETYSGNDKISIYIDGVLEDWTIIDNYKTGGYCSALETQGYTRAYDMDKEKKELDDAKKNYEETLDWYNYATNFALVKPKQNSDNG